MNNMEYNSNPEKLPPPASRKQSLKSQSSVDKRPKMKGI